MDPGSLLQAQTRTKVGKWVDLPDSSGFPPHLPNPPAAGSKMLQSVSIPETGRPTVRSGNLVDRRFRSSSSLSSCNPRRRVPSEKEFLVRPWSRTFLALIAVLLTAGTIGCNNDADKSSSAPSPTANLTPKPASRRVRRAQGDDRGRPPRRYRGHADHPQQADGVEPVPFRRDRQGRRHRLRPLLGHDRRTSTSPPPTARASASSTTTTTASSTSTSPPPRSLPLGTAEKRPEPALSRTWAAASSRT